MQTLYHGTISPRANHIKDFWPLTHFGTQQAALDTIARKGTPGIPEIYEVTVDVKSSITLPDIGSPRPLAMINQLRDASLITPDHHASLRTGIGALEKDSTGHPEYKQGRLAARRLVAEALCLLGVDAVRYENKVEHMGSVSVCVIDTSIISSIMLLRSVPRSPDRTGTPGPTGT